MWGFQRRWALLVALIALLGASRSEAQTTTELSCQNTNLGSGIVQQCTGSGTISAGEQVKSRRSQTLSVALPCISSHLMGCTTLVGRIECTKSAASVGSERSGRKEVGHRLVPMPGEELHMLTRCLLAGHIHLDPAVGLRGDGIRELRRRPGRAPELRDRRRQSVSPVLEATHTFTGLKSVPRDFTPTILLHRFWCAGKPPCRPARRSPVTETSGKTSSSSTSKLLSTCPHMQAFAGRRHNLFHYLFWLGVNLQGCATAGRSLRLGNTSST